MNNKIKAAVAGAVLASASVLMPVLHGTRVSGLWI